MLIELAIKAARLALDSLDEESLRNALVGLTKHDQLDSSLAKEVVHVLSGSQSILALGQMNPLMDEDAPDSFERLTINDQRLWALSYSRISIWELESNMPVYWHEHSFPLDSSNLSLSGDGRYFAAALVRRDFGLWDANSFEQIHTFTGHSGEVDAISFLDDERLISCSGDGSVRLWDIGSGKQLRSVETLPCYCLALHPSKRQIAAGGSAGGEGWVIVFDVESLEPIKEFRFAISQQPFPALSQRGRRSAGITAERRDKAVIASLAWHPDGRHLWAGSWDRTIKLVDTVEGTHRELVGHGHWVSTIVVTRAGQAVSSGGSDGMIIVWSADSTEPLQIMDLDAPIGGLCHSKGRLYVAVGDTIRIFRLPR